MNGKKEQLCSQEKQERRKKKRYAEGHEEIWRTLMFKNWLHSNEIRLKTEWDTTDEVEITFTALN